MTWKVVTGKAPWFKMVRHEAVFLWHRLSFPARVPDFRLKWINYRKSFFRLLYTSLEVLN